MHNIYQSISPFCSESFMRAEHILFGPLQLPLVHLLSCIPDLTNDERVEQICIPTLILLSRHSDSPRNLASLQGPARHAQPCAPTRKGDNFVMRSTAFGNL
jgi:hypothetical protein